MSHPITFDSHYVIDQFIVYIFFKGENLGAILRY